MSGAPKRQAEPHKPETSSGSGHRTRKGNTFRRLGILAVTAGRPGSEEWEGQGLKEAQRYSHRKVVTWTSHGDPEKTGRNWSLPGDPVRPHRPETDSKRALVCALKTYMLVPQEGKGPAAPATNPVLAWAETLGAVSSRAGVQKCRCGISDRQKTLLRQDTGVELLPSHN